MNILLWLTFGAITGYIAHISDSNAVSGGLSTSIFIGMGGAVVGGVIANTLFGDALFTLDIVSFTLALSVTILALLIHRTIFTIPHSVA